eukprot:jgi/Bigna1/82997/fgenesh1_pg.100_\
MLSLENSLSRCRQLNPPTLFGCPSPNILGKGGVVHRNLAALNEPPTDAHTPPHMENKRTDNVQEEAGGKQNYDDDDEGTVTDGISNSDRNHNERKEGHAKLPSDTEKGESKEEEPTMLQPDTDEIKGLEKAFILYKISKIDQAFKVVGIIEAPLQHLLSLIIEADLIPTFINFITIIVDQLKVKSPYHQILYSRVPLPWPLDDRDVIINAQGFDLLDEFGEIVISATSVKEFPDTKIPEVPPKCTRLEIHLAGARIKPITMNKIELTAVANVDFKSFLPSSVINWLAKTLAYYFFLQFRAKAASSSGNGPHYDRVNEKKEMYTQVMGPIIEYFRNKGDSSEQEIARTETKNEAVDVAVNGGKEDENVVDTKDVSRD